MKYTLITLSVLSLAACIIGCHSNVTSLTVPLEYRPTDEGAGGGLTLPPAKIYVADVDDQRSNTQQIGENREDKPIPVFPGDVSPTKFVRDALIEEFRNDGMNVVDSPDDADRIVNVSILKFFVTEMNTYDAEVTLKAKITDKSGNVVAAEIIGRGDDSTFGRSLSPDNYVQVLSNATAKAINYLVSKPDFVKALSTGTGE